MFLCDTEDTIFIVGDFNLLYINWESSDSPEDQIHSVFLDFSLKSGLNQFVNKSTLGDNILDLVLSTDKLIVSDLNVTCPFSSGDHNMVFLIYCLNQVNQFIKNHVIITILTKAIMILLMIICTTTHSTRTVLRQTLLKMFVSPTL